MIIVIMGASPCYKRNHYHCQYEDKDCEHHQQNTLNLSFLQRRLCKYEKPFLRVHHTCLWNGGEIPSPCFAAGSSYSLFTRGDRKSICFMCGIIRKDVTGKVSSHWLISSFFFLPTPSTILTSQIYWALNILYLPKPILTHPALFPAYLQS
jgi:hypothetical protein